MAKLQTPQKLRVEDFKSDQQDLVSKIALLYNAFVDQVYNALNKNIDFDNLNRQVVDVTLSIDSSGKVVNSPQVKTTLITKIRGMNVINAINTKNSKTYPTSHPFISWTVNGNILTILNVSGLQNSSEYKLTLEIIG